MSGKQVPHKVRQGLTMKIINGYPRVKVGDRWRLAEQRRCQICGKAFWAATNKSHPVMFCSVVCRGKNRVKQWKSKRVARRCIICSKVSYYKASDAKRHKTCGRPDCVLALQRSNAKLRQGVNGFGEYHNKRPRDNGRFA